MTKVIEALTEPCAVCPFRIANQGQKHKHGFYTKANLRRLWAGLRRGEGMTCHMTDPRMAEFEGYERTASAQTTRECAGALILQQREFMRLQDALQAGQDVRQWCREHPRSLTRVGAVQVMFAAAGMGRHNTLVGTGSRPNLNAEGVGHPDLEPWVRRSNGQQST